MVKPAKQSLTWGAWLKARAQVVGFRRLRDLAVAVGCDVNQLSRWTQMTAPPPAMRKGYDAAIIQQLRTDRRTLFIEFARVTPEDAPLIDAAADSTDAIKRKVLAVVELLDADRLRELHQRGRELLKKEMATSAA